MEKRKPKPLATLAALSVAMKEEMVAVLIRNPIAFDGAVGELTVADVRTIADSIGLIWGVVLQFHQTHARLPELAELRAQVNQRSSENESLIEEEGQTDSDGFLDYAFDPVGQGDITTKARATSALATLKRFLRERHAIRLKELMSGDEVPEDLAAVLETARRDVERLDTLDGGEVEQPFPVGWDTVPRPQLITTGVDTLDAFMGGGWQAGETLLFMGPYGSCKTTMTIHGVSAGLKAADALYRSNAGVGGRKPVVVLYFTEGSKDTYRVRLLSRMATVPWKRLAQMRGLVELSNSNQPARSEETQYETVEFPNPNSGFLPERGRVTTATGVANEHLVLIDGSDRDGGAIGVGGPKELVAKLRAYQAKHPDHYFHSVWVDHLSAWARRSVVAQGRDPKDALRHELLAMVMVCGDLIAGRLQTPVALMHQFSGQANKRGPGARFHHSDAAECAAMAEYVDFAVNTGPTDHQLLCNWSCTKHRREPPVANRIVRVRGQFNTVLDCTATHYLDEGKKMIVPKSQMDAAEAHAEMIVHSFTPNQGEVIS